MYRTLCGLALASCSMKLDTTTRDASDGTPLDGETDADTDTDTDADADTDSDTDADVDTTGTGDTGATSLAWDGTYKGTVTAAITYQVSPDGPTLLLDCAGEVEVTVDGAVAPVIDGTGTCLVAYGTEVFDVVLSGDLTADPDAAGLIGMTSPTVQITDDWTGGFAVDTLSGHAEGQTAGYPLVVWSVDFSADR